jgi:hypothetical protein
MLARLPARIDRKSHKQDAGKRSPAHRAWVRGFACSIPGCDGRPIECAHFRDGTGGGISMKPSDRWVWSACADHHREQHQIGERAFQAKYGIDLRALCETFAKQSPHWPKLREMV